MCFCFTCCLICSSSLSNSSRFSEILLFIIVTLILEGRLSKSSITVCISRLICDIEGSSCDCSGSSLEYCRYTFPLDEGLDVVGEASVLDILICIEHQILSPQNL